ncbi:thioredoxin family protein [Priestia megaterium]|uniref:thioredoxin family protein n=1 Tax=Priestia megaterium TaxID=1404 RepID=UPI002E1F10B0|nr:thioredoxin family protein [Priestia megaterium]
MKKMLIFLGFIALCFIIFQAYTPISNSQFDGKNTVYQKEHLHPKTIEQLKDKNYKNIVRPEVLNKLLNSQKYNYVYFYRSTCTYCKKATPKLNSISETLHIKLQLYNLEEFDQGWDNFKITKTPTLVVFKDGKELKRLEGLREYKEYQAFLTINNK